MASTRRLACTLVLTSALFASITIGSAVATHTPSAPELLCSYAGPPDNTVTFTTGDGEETLTIRRVGEEIKLFSEHHIGRVKGKGKRKRIRWRTVLDSPTCNAVPTVHNTDTIKVVVVAEEIVDLDISMEGGAFAPGATAEGDGSAEIEVAIQLEDLYQTVSFVGSSANDHFRFGMREGAGGVNLNAQDEGSSPDVDATTTIKPDPFDPRPSIPTAAARTGVGDDMVTIAGGAEFDSGFPGALQANGGPGNDSLIGTDSPFAFIKGAGGNDLIQGGRRFNFIFGGSGDDTVIGGPRFDGVELGGGRDQAVLLGGKDVVAARDGRGDRIHCGRRRDVVGKDKKDRTPGCERKLLEAFHLKPFDH